MNNPKVTPKDFFLWAGAMISLYGSAIAFITLLFQYINYAYPDPLSYAYMDPFSSGIRTSMASLIVLMPVALLLLRVIRKEIQRDPIKVELWVRRWALVLTIFVAGAAMVGDLIMLINYFLGGDLTTRFVLKVAILLLVAGAVFLHFLADLRGYWNANPKYAQMVGYAAGAVVLLSIVAGFFIMGSPAQVRLYRYDSEKVWALQDIQGQVVNFWQQKEELPESLSDLEDPLSGWTVPKDPQGGQLRYEKTGDKSFKLCATFNADSRETGASDPMMRMYGVSSENFSHGTGDVCFDRTIDPERYPPYSKPVPAPVR